MKNYQIFIGVDISKLSLDVCLIYQDKPKDVRHFKIANTAIEIRKFIHHIEKRSPGSDILYCMEDTGVYGLPLCVTLGQANADYAVIPAIQIKRSKGLKRGKTDKADAKDIALYGLTHQHEIHLYQMPESDMQQLKLMLAERDKLVKAIQQFESTQEALIFMDKKIFVGLSKHNAKTSGLLKKQLIELEKAISDLVNSNQKMSEQTKLLQSIPGIGPQIALQMICYTRCFSLFENWRQFACYSGVAPFEYQSGTSIRGRTKVSHFAQKKLKSLLNMGALSAKRHDVELKNYFDRKVAEGKNKMLVVNAIRCKLLARAFAVINRGTPFVNTNKFATC